MGTNLYARFVWVERLTFGGVSIVLIVVISSIRIGELYGVRRGIVWRFWGNCMAGTLVNR